MPSVLGYLRWVDSVTADAPLILLACVRWREFCVVSAARGSPFPGFFLAVSDDFVFLGQRAADFAADGLLASRQCRNSTVASSRNAARELCPIYF